MKNKIYINGQIGAILENNELVSVYENITQVRKYRNENNTLVLEVNYVYTDYDEEYDWDGYVQTVKADFNDTAEYIFNDYDVVVKNNKIIDLSED